jgi:DNA replicative helicase MCM subunit Mcm2 (Cdc46/Mcm family)
MKSAVISKLRKVAETIRKIAMATQAYLVTYAKPNTITLKNSKGIEYTFNDYNINNEKSFQNWLIKEVKSKEHLGDDAIEDILLQTYSEIKQGKTNFNIKFYNLNIKTPELVY